MDGGDHCLCGPWRTHRHQLPRLRLRLLLMPGVLQELRRRPQAEGERVHQLPDHHLHCRPHPVHLRSRVSEASMRMWHHIAGKTLAGVF